MANQKKPNSRKLSGEPKAGFGDDTEELDFEKILAEYGGTDQREETQKKTSETENSESLTASDLTGSEATASETETIRNPGMPETVASEEHRQEKSSSAEQDRRALGRKSSSRSARYSQRGSERTGASGTENTLQPDRSTGAEERRRIKDQENVTRKSAEAMTYAAGSRDRAAGQRQAPGNAGQQNNTANAGQPQTFGNAGQQNNTANAGQSQTFGNAGQPNSTANAGQSHTYGNVGQLNGTFVAGQAQTYGTAGQQNNGALQRIVSAGTASRQPETIDLVEVFYLMWSNLWKIILCLILGAAIAFSYTWYLVVPQYQATSKIYVVSSSSSSVINLSDLQLGTQLTADYEELILNHELLEDVIDALSLDMTYGQLKGMITITNPDDTRILRITVTSSDPVLARDIANELSRQAIVFLPEIMETAEPNIAEEAVLPTSPSSPSYTRNTLMGGLVGAALCMGILLVLYLMDDTVKSPDDLEKYFGTQPLSTVAECAMEGERKKKGKKDKAEKGKKADARKSSAASKSFSTSKTGVGSQAGTASQTGAGVRSGISSQTGAGSQSGIGAEINRRISQDGTEDEYDEYRTNPGSRTLQVTKLPNLPFDVSESLNQLRVNLSFCGSGIRSIMITSSLPNEGKSFITMNLWKMMARSGQKTLLIDADLRNSELRSTYGITCEDKVKGIAYYLAGRIPLEQAIYETNIPNGYMLPLASSVANPSILLENGRFGQMIEECAKEFDYILVDTPPIGSVADALNIATHCDGTVLVVHGGETPRKLVGNSIQLLKRTGVPLLGLVLNRAEINSKAGGYYYRRYYRYGGYYYKNGYGHYGYGGYGAADKKKQSKSRK